MTEQDPMMINADPLKPHLKAVELAEQAWAAVGVAYDSAPAAEKGDFAESFRLAEQAYNIACSQLAGALAGEVKDALGKPATSQLLLEQTLVERARAHLAGVCGFYESAKAGTAYEAERIEYQKNHAALNALLELSHLADSGMSTEGRDALLAVEIEAAAALLQYCKPAGK